MKCLTSIILLLLQSLWLYGQQRSDFYGEHTPLPTSAYNSFQKQVETFTLGFLWYRTRAIEQGWNSQYVNGIKFNSLSESRIPYSALGALYSVSSSSVSQLDFSYDNSLALRSVGGSTYDYIDPTDKHLGMNASVALSSRSYAHRAGIGYTAQSRNARISIDASRRFGHSLLVDGVYSDNYNFTLSSTIDMKESGKLNITALFNPSERATARASTKEAFELSSNNLYNPAWGMQGNRQRSTYVRRSKEPIFIASHKLALKDGKEINSAVAVLFGEESYSALSWQGAPNPLPDYYAYMPSYQESPLVAELISQAWKSDVNISQVSFEELYRINGTGSSRANYIIEDRVTKPLFMALSSRLSDKNFGVGVSVRAQSDHHYKQIASLLGGNYWLDVDTFIEQDGDLKELTQNNVQDPNRKVTTGDIFGYNYRINNLELNLDGTYTLQKDRFRLAIGGAISTLITQRIGYYEKENFLSARSLGASEVKTGLEWRALVDAHYRFSSSLTADASVALSSLSPRSSTIFLSEEYRNAMTPNLTNAQVLSLSGTLRYRGDDLNITGSVYYYSQSNGTSLSNHYDDMLYSYVHYPMYNISSIRTGFEASIEARLVDDFWLSGALMLQSNRYSDNPTAMAIEQSTGKILIESETLFLDGVHLGGTPETIGVVSLSYQRYNWSVRLSATAFTSAYEVPSPLRYSSRILQYTDSEYDYEVLRQQSKLSGGVQLDIFGGYRFRFTGGSTLGLYATISNLTNNQGIERYGYQSDRFFRDGWTLTPQPSRYYYTLPLNFSLSVVLRP